MQLSNIDFTKNNLTVDIGYRGEFSLTVKFTDQNNKEHHRVFYFRVFGEKPTTFTVERMTGMIYQTDSNSTN